MGTGPRKRDRRKRGTRRESALIRFRIDNFPRASYQYSRSEHDFGGLLRPIPILRSFFRDSRETSPRGGGGRGGHFLPPAGAHFPALASTFSHLLSCNTRFIYGRRAREKLSAATLRKIMTKVRRAAKTRRFRGDAFFYYFSVTVITVAYLGVQVTIFIFT